MDTEFSSDVPLGISTAAGLGSLLVAGYLLTSEITTLPNSGQPATPIEAGNPVLIGFALLPVVLSAVAILALRYERELLALASGFLVVLLGLVGWNFGFLYVGIGVAILISYAVAAST